ncbi:lipopolysaccharide biosynthesis protein [Kurthia huakuii]|uniref:lipopolysaccharide biosynthesis protein n=1 Tax=Kurthia huakuii TaxID=1421019 RepID=UPI000496E8A4|nr:oligosaccharide flippase family protein [Kurthia huakuii]MBM7697956.1 O-antigen/teichoic acid export membrane protein [Kurthia huakuii]
MKKWMQKQLKHRFIRALSVLVAGSAVSSIILLCITPILTRLYTPEDFGVLSIFTSILYVLMIIVSFRYEAALVLPKEKKAALALLFIANASTFIVAGIVILLLVLTPFTTWIGIGETHSFFWILGLSLLFVGIFQSMNNWALRYEQYDIINRAKISMNTGQGFGQLLFGFLNMGVIGLLLGEMLGRLTGMMQYIRYYRKDLLASQKTSLQQMKEMVIRYKKFPLVSSISNVIYSVAVNLPPLFLAAYFDVATAGFYYLAQKILTVPENLVGFSATQVYLSQAAKMMQDGQDLKKHCLETVKHLFIIAFVIIVSIDIFAPIGFTFFFGHGWDTTVTFIQILSLMYFTKMVLQPINGVFQVCEAFYMQITAELIRLVFIILALVFASTHEMTHIEAMWMISIMTTLGYIVCAIFAWQVMNKVGDNRDDIGDNSKQHEI